MRNNKYISTLAYANLFASQAIEAQNTASFIQSHLVIGSHNTKIRRETTTQHGEYTKTSEAQEKPNLQKENNENWQKRRK